MNELDTAVVEGDASAAVADEASKPKPRGTPKWETEARDRLRAAMRRFNKPLADLVARDANEGDTRLLVTDFLCDGLGFDKYEDLTTEYQVKGEFADYGIRIDSELVAFIEVKRSRPSSDPPPPPGADVRRQRGRRVDDPDQRLGVAGLPPDRRAAGRHRPGARGRPPRGRAAGHKVSQLFYLTRESLKRRQIDELWKAKRATSPASLAQVLVSDNVAEAIRKELWRQTGHRVETPEIARLLTETVLRPAALKDNSSLPTPVDPVTK